MKNRSTIVIKNCQVKSLEKLEKLADALDTIEKECGIHEVKITFENMFICPDIDLAKPANHGTPMEKLVAGLFIKFDQMKYGKDSNYKKV